MNLFDSDKLDIVLTASSGIESVLKSEIRRMGYGDVPAVNGELAFKGNAFDIARLNLNLRTADRVYVRLASFTASTFDQLYDGVYATDWKSVLPKDAKVYVNGKCVKSTLFATSACQGMVKKAIVDKAINSYNLSSFSETGKKYDVLFKIFKDNCEILLNTSGDGLHKRGYRDMVGIAPIKETLASAMILMSDYYWERPFLDPFCGSGTLTIEALLIALNVACGKFRKFSFNEWKNFNPVFYKRALEEALDNEKLDRKVEIYGSDIDKKAVNLSKHHLERVGLKNRIEFKVSDVYDAIVPGKGGSIVTNPPYGERVYDIKEAESAYKSLGSLVKRLSDWSTFVITPHRGFEKKFGKKADRIRKLYNSNIECNYYFYYGKKEKYND